MSDARRKNHICCRKKFSFKNNFLSKSQKKMRSQIKELFHCQKKGTNIDFWFLTFQNKKKMQNCTK
jgi:hypothetical protein